MSMSILTGVDRVDNNKLEQLQDVKNGHVIDWKGKKLMSEKIAQGYHILGDQRKAERISECGSFLQFKLLTDETMKLTHANFCRCRLCQMCSWRRALALAVQNRKIITEANHQQKLQWLFLTISIKNSTGEKLKGDITTLMQGFNRLTKYKRVQGAVVGWYRVLEVTRNTDKESKDFGTYNPHFHVLICVKSSYFNGGNYIKQSEWRDMWHKAVKTPYKPYLHITKVKPKGKWKEVIESIPEVERAIKERIGMEGALAEVSKYSVKGTDIIGKTADETAENLQYLDKALAHRRLVAYGGLLKEIKEQLQLQDVEGDDVDLVHTDEDKDETAEAIATMTAHWHPGLKNYIVKRGE